MLHVRPTCCDASQAGVLKLLGCLKEKIADARGVRAIAMLSVTNAGSQARFSAGLLRTFDSM